MPLYLRPPGELGYAEIAGSTTTQFTSTSSTDFTGMSVAVVCSGRPIKLIFETAVCITLTGGVSQYSVEFYDSTGAASLSIKPFWLYGSQWTGMHFEHRIASPAVGVRAYKMRVKLEAAGTIQFGYDLSPFATPGPTFLQAVEL